jgi:dimethylamine/trimethylamine dehydrogenase
MALPMPRNPAHDILFEPIEIGPRVLRNRFYQVPHCTGFGTDFPGSQARFRAMKAQGGWGAVCTEICSVHPEADRAHQALARIWDDDDLANLSLLCEEVHAEGALVGVELFHPGPNVEGSLSREVPGAPTGLPSDMYPLTYPREMTVSEIEETQGFYALAAERARSVGFDIVYVYGAHGYLPMQFLSSFYNQRTDGYGGSLERRARFWIETLQAVRDAVEGQVTVAARISVDSDGRGGVRMDEALSFIQMADPFVDLWDVNVSPASEGWRDMAPSTLYPAGWQLEWTSRVHEVTRTPVVGVGGRFTDPDQMARVIRSGALDIIGAARPSIADPFLPRKIELGDYDDIRECIGCNICLGRAVHTGRIACTQNATAGEEYRRGWHPERFTPATDGDRTVLVIGGGVAGMECAIVLGRRGYDRVHLVEGGEQLGGYASLVSTLPHRGEWHRLVDWRVVQLKKLRNVEVLTRLQLDTTATAQYGADVIIVATGAGWRRDGTSHVTHAPLPGAELPHVVTPETVLRRTDHGSGSVVVYDCEGYFMGVGLAELLASAGRHVTVVTPHRVVAPFLDGTYEGFPTRERLGRLGVSWTVDAELVEINRGSIRLARFGIEQETAADEVVLVTARRSSDELYRELVADPETLASEQIQAVYRIGDCAAPRLLADAIFDGHRLGRELDSPNPARPLPYIRERAVWGRAVLAHEPD